MHRIAAYIKIFPVIFAALLFAGCAGVKEDEIILRVCSWEEYIDEGGWDEDEAIDLGENGIIKGDEAIYKEFEDWYYEKYNKKVKVYYSTAGTNEDLYNQLTIGDTFDLICPSEYMMMKLAKEDKIETFSDDFFDEENEDNYYIRGLSPYIRRIFEENEINGKPWERYFAGYMWGTTGIVFNADNVKMEEARHWDILNDRAHYRRVTIKDNVRDSYFMALAMLKSDILKSKEFVSSSDYAKRLAVEMNDTDEEVVSQVGALLKDIKKNVYSFETDSAKADMAAGKVDASYQWSGDAVYIMDVSEDSQVNLSYVVPDECGNLWFDGWLMLKDGIGTDTDKKHAAQAFVNYISRPDNVVRNMNYIGYTSAISGGDDDTIFDYVNWCYGTDKKEDTIDYDITYFFAGERSGRKYTVTAEKGSEYKGLGTQYPDLDTIKRCAVMDVFTDEAYERINRMWINVRCFNIHNLFQGGS